MGSSNRKRKSSYALNMQDQKQLMYEVFEMLQLKGTWKWLIKTLNELVGNDIIDCGVKQRGKTL